MPALVMVAEGKETRVELQDRPLVFGRSTECDVQVPEVRASRHHFRVEPSDRGWILTDLDSSNGTALNAYGVSRVLLTHGDLVEVGSVSFRYETETGPVVPRAPRQPPKPMSAGPAWVGALVAAISLGILADFLAVDAARSRDREIRAAREAAAHVEFLLSGREPDEEKVEALLAAHLRDHPRSTDAPQARARLEALRASREVKRAASADFDSLKAAAPGLSPDEYRWRLDQLVRLWAESPDGLAEIRRRAPELVPPEAPVQDARVLFQRRKREADAAVAAGEFGRALALWNAHALESPASAAAGEGDLRAEVRAIEDAAEARAVEVLAKAAAFRDRGETAEALRLLRAAAPSLAGTGGGRRLEWRIESGLGTASPRAAAAGPSAGGAEGFALKRGFYLRAKEAEQFVALRDFRAAASGYASIAADAGSFPDVRAEMEARGAELRRVADLLDSLRSSGGTWKGKPWPDSWDQVPAEDLAAALAKIARKPEEKLACAAFAFDQGLRKQAVEAICVALDSDLAHAEAERMWSVREGIPVPEGGFVAEKGEVIPRAEWKRRRNAEAIVKLREKQSAVVRRIHESQLVRGLDRMRALRADLEKSRAFALELIFDEVKYFYPYQDRMGEYTPVQQEVDRRVAAVRKIWDDRTKFRAKADSGTQQALREFDEAAKQLREMGAEAAAPDREVEDLRRYIDRDLDVRTFFTDAADLADHEWNAGVMRENLKRRAVAEESELQQVAITNEYRIMMGRRALLVADKLVLSARAHGDDMSRGGFFDHFNVRLQNMKPGEKIPKQACGCSSDGFVPGCTHGPDARIRAQGYEFAACSENIHAGSGDPEGAHNGWIHSSGHHRNLLHSAWKEMGTGRVGKHWTQNFGLPVEAGAEPEGAGSEGWDRAGGRGTGEDGNPPDGGGGR